MGAIHLLLFLQIFLPYGFVIAIGATIPIVVILGGVDKVILGLIKPLEFRNCMKTRNEGTNQEVIIIFEFRNNTRQPMTIDEYDNKIVFNEIKLVDAKNISYERVVSPFGLRFWEWQPEPFNWVDPPSYHVSEAGKYTLTSKVRFYYDGKEIELQSKYIYEQETDYDYEAIGIDDRDFK